MQLVFVTTYRHGVLTGKRLLVAYPPHVRSPGW
jgi:hypothetical protein